MCYIHVCIYVYMFICILEWVRIYVRMYVCMYVYMYVCLYVRIYVRIYVCMYVCMYECVCVCKSYAGLQSFAPVIMSATSGYSNELSSRRSFILMDRTCRHIHTYIQYIHTKALILYGVTIWCFSDVSKLLFKLLFFSVATANGRPFSSI